VTTTFAVVEEIALAARVTIEETCRTLQVSRAGFYAWRSENPSARDLRDRELSALVKRIFHSHRRRYGARRIAAEIREQGESCSVAHAAKLLKNSGLRAIQPKSYKPKTTDSRHRLGYSPNLLEGLCEVRATNRVWVGDLSYVPIRSRGFAYLSVLMDRYSRKIIAWNIGETMQESLVLETLRGAIRARRPAVGLIHHTDRGGQYAGRVYRAVLRRAGLRQSMSRAENVYDNAFMESCFGTIKRELEMTEYDSMRRARCEIAAYVVYYNAERRHSSLGYLSPEEFEEN
jgi:transposase InsO family protein